MEGPLERALASEPNGLRTNVRDGVWVLMIDTVTIPLGAARKDDEIRRCFSRNETTDGAAVGLWSVPMESRARHDVLRTRVTAPPPDRGRLWYDFEIPDAFLAGLPGIEQKVRWIREHLPRESRIRIGQKSAWYEADIRAFLESRRAAP